MTRGVAAGRLAAVPTPRPAGCQHHRSYSHVRFNRMYLCEDSERRRRMPRRIDAGRQPFRWPTTRCAIPQCRTINPGWISPDRFIAYRTPDFRGHTGQDGEPASRIVVRAETGATMGPPFGAGSRPTSTVPGFFDPSTGVGSVSSGCWQSRRPLTFLISINRVTAVSKNECHDQVRGIDFQSTSRIHRIGSQEGRA